MRFRMPPIRASDGRPTRPVDPPSNPVFAACYGCVMAVLWPCHTPPTPDEDVAPPVPLHVTPQIEIQDWEMTEQFVRASGPGGQNVNKVSSAVELRFEAERSPGLPGPVKARLRRLAGRRWTRDGAVVIQVSEERSQARNREIARDRLAALVRAASVAPKKRVKTRVSSNQKRKRVEAKKRRSEVKALRGGVDTGPG